MKIIGIDPGLKGGLAVLEDGKIIDLITMPIYELKNGKNNIDIKKVAEFFRKHNPDKVCIEKVGAGIVGGRVSMWNFGYSTGNLVGCILTLNYELINPTPQRWKKIVLGEKYDHKEKEGTIKFCQDTFPGINLLATKRSKVPSDGLADSIALAVYASMETTHETT